MEFDSTFTKMAYVRLLLRQVLRSSTFWLIVAIVFGFTLGSFLAKSLAYYAAAIGTVTALYHAMWLIYTVSTPKNKYFFTKKHFILSDEKLIVQTPVVEQVIQWEAFNKWERVAGFYLLTFSNGKWAAIAETDIPSDRIRDFEDLLMRKIDKIAARRRGI